VEGDACDIKSGAALLELRRAVRGSDAAQEAKERSAFGKCEEDFLHSVSKMDQRGRIQRVVLPIDILGVQRGDVTLATSEMPAEFVEGFALGIFLASNDLLMLIEGHRSFVAIADGWPVLIVDERLGQPVHADREIMHAT